MKFWCIKDDFRIALLGGEQGSTWLIGHFNCQNASVFGRILTSPLLRHLKKCYKKEILTNAGTWVSEGRKGKH